MVVKRKKYKFEVLFFEKPYPRTAPAVKWERKIDATDRKDADAWAKYLHKDKGVNSIMIKKLKRKEWW
jgi:hypothetical protein